MIKSTLELRTTKKEGTIRLRFRLTDGRRANLYHKSEIKADLNELSKLTKEGEPKPKISVYNKALVEKIRREREAMEKAYQEMQERGLDLNGKVFEDIVNNILHPSRIKSDSMLFLLPRFKCFIDDGETNGVFGKARKSHYNVVYGILERFLSIKHNQKIKTTDFTSDLLIELYRFISNEWEYVELYPEIYQNKKYREIPKCKRAGNTVAAKLKLLQAFFTDLEDSGEVDKSPFRAIGRRLKGAMFREKYDEPVSLSIDELKKILGTEVPEHLQETKDTFLLHCALGCRIGDFQSLNMGKVGIKDGIPYIHYLPKKTMREQKDNSEVETPLVLFALEVVRKYQMKFGILRNVSGKDGYNARIKELLKVCGINRQVKIFNEEKGDNIYKQLYEVASSKLCRKTHVDITTKAQVDKYVSGLHKEGSKAVERYTKLGIKERFILFCSAFREKLYKVDDDLNVQKYE